MLRIQHGGASYAMWVRRTGRAMFGNFLLASTGGSTFAGLLVEGCFVLENNPCVITCVGAPALRIDGGRFETNYYIDVTASAPGGGAALIDNGGQFVGATPYGTLRATNTSTAANSDGVRVRAGARANCATAPVIASSGSSGFGVNARGGGQFLCPAQPTQVTGPTADFSVGTAAGENFNDTDLALAYAAYVTGLSVVQRTT